MSQAFPKLVLGLMYGMEELSADGADSDQLLHWMGWIAETIGQLDPPERVTLVATARQLADEADRSGDAARADAYRHIADAEGLV